MNKKRTLDILQAIIFTFILLMISCEKEYVIYNDAGITAKEPVAKDTSDINDTTPTTDTTGNGGATVLFSRDLQPIFKATCQSCHSSDNKLILDSKHAYSALVNGGYVNTNNPEGSKLFNNSRKGHPDDQLSTSEHKLFVTWMKEGALNN